jgi:hypothetical protein
MELRLLGFFVSNVGKWDSLIFTDSRLDHMVGSRCTASHASSRLTQDDDDNI